MAKSSRAHRSVVLAHLMNAARSARRKQCPSVCALGGGATFCVKSAGHAGDHRGHRAQWNEKGRVPISEPLE